MLLHQALLLLITLLPSCGSDDSASPDATAAVSPSPSPSPTVEPEPVERMSPEWKTAIMRSCLTQRVMNAPDDSEAYIDESAAYCSCVGDALAARYTDEEYVANPTACVEQLRADGTLATCMEKQ